MIEPSAPDGPEGVSTLLPGFTPEQLICEGWVQKESRLLLEWRARWLVLYRDHLTHLPVLCTFKEARCDWDWAAMPEPTERVDLIGCSCAIQADPSSTNDLTFSLSLRSVRSLTFSSGSKAAPTHVFTVSSQSATFAFATESAHESQRWVGEISRGIAEAAMEACRRGGVPCVLPPQSPTAQTLAAPATPEHHTKVVGVAPGAAAAAHGSTALLETRNAQLEAQVQQLQGALGAMLLGELAAELEELGAREDELRRQLDEAAGAAGTEAAGGEAAGGEAAGGEEGGGEAAGGKEGCGEEGGAGHADDAVASEAREARELAAHLEAELASVASQGVLVRRRMEELASGPGGGSPALLSQPTATEAADEEEGVSPSYQPFGALPDASQPRPTADAAPGFVLEASLYLEAGAMCDELDHKETDEEYVPFGASGLLAPTEPLVLGSEPWQLVVAEDAAAESGEGGVEEQAVISAGAHAERRGWGTV